MPKTSRNPITSLDQSWSRDPNDGNLPFSGAAVENFIKQNLGSIAKAVHFDPSTYTLYWFDSEEKRAEYVANPDDELVLYSVHMSFESKMYRVSLTNNNQSTSINVATNQDTLELDIDFVVQEKTVGDASWLDTSKGVNVTVEIDRNATGNFVTIDGPTFYAAGESFSFDIRQYLNVGTSRVRVRFVSEESESVVASITYTILMSEMFIEPLLNQWYVPIVETGDPSNYKLGGFRIIGNVNKTLHLELYSANRLVADFEEPLLTTSYDTSPYYYRKQEGLDLSELDSGVYQVKAYLTAGDITSQPVLYNIIYIAEGDEHTAQYVAINELEETVYNYTTPTLFKYCIYNKGELRGSPRVVVRKIVGQDETEIVNVVINDISTSEVHSYEQAIEWEIYDTSINLRLSASLIFGNTQTHTAIVDNRYTYPPTRGYVCYLNAENRSNSESNKEKIINAATNQELTPQWSGMSWIDGIDGWTTDETGKKCLNIPARAKMILPYSQFKILRGSNITVEMCYRVANVTDYDEVAIAVMNDFESAGFNGIRIKPTNITVHSSLDSGVGNDAHRGTNVMDDQIVHFVLTIQSQYRGISDKNIVTGYVNGSKNFQFDFANNAIWSQQNDLRIGCEKSDISLYFIRVYDTVLPFPAVQANYINSLGTIAARSDMAALLSSCMGDLQSEYITLESVKNNEYNYFVIEMLNGVDVPSRANGWAKGQSGLSNLEMHFGKHPDWDWRIESVETGGQGTTSMDYYRWNLRWRIDKSSGKQVNVQYCEGRTSLEGSYQYTWGESTQSKTLRFDGTQHPALKRMTAKINQASSMQSHKIGATRAYTEIHDELELYNEAEQYAIEHNKQVPVVSVYQYPAFGFKKEGNTYTFIGLFTIGPDKGDKPSFGYDMSDGNMEIIAPNLITMEGTDHGRKMVMFNYPWNNDVQYRADNECINIVKGVNDFDNGWEVGNCHKMSTDDTADETAIQSVLESEFKPAYDVVYENSTLIIGIPLGVYGADVSSTLEYINSHISDFSNQLDSNNRLTYANYQFWIEGEYDLYYYDIVAINPYLSTEDKEYRGIYKKNGQNLVEQCGSPSVSTVDEQNEWFKTRRRELFKAQAENYWDIPDTLFHIAFIVIIGAIDNFGKNTYPYKMATLAQGGRWKWRQDDLDSILGIGNAGNDNIPNWIEFTDSRNGSVYYGGSSSVFWNLVYECYYNNYTSAIDGSPHDGFIAVGRGILDAMNILAGGTNKYDGITKYFKTRFWDNAQNYFPQSAYNADANFKYEQAWIEGNPDRQQTVPPLTQSLGNHYLAEQFWVNRRVVYAMSLFKAGAFGDYADPSLGIMSFRPQSMQSLTVKPIIDLYPAFASGQGLESTARTKGGQQYTFVGPFGSEGQTTYYIMATNMLLSIGDLKKLILGEGYVNALSVNGKKLVEFKIGDEDPTEVDTNVPGLSFTGTVCIEKIDARNANSITGVINLSECKRLKEAYLVGTSLTSVILQNGSKIEKLSLPDSIQSIMFRNLLQLTDANLTLPSDKSNIEQILVLNCRIDTLGLLYAIFSSTNSKLRYFNIAMYRQETVDATYVDMLVKIIQGKNKDGQVVYGGYHGISSDGTPLPTANPTIDGTFNLVSSFYDEDFEILSLVDVEPLPGDPTKQTARVPFFGSLHVIYDPNGRYLTFEDNEVLRILANWIGDGRGVSLRQVESTTSLPVEKFRGNTIVASFEEFEYFTGITSLPNGNVYSPGAFSQCTNLTTIKLPETLLEIGSYSFSGSGLTHIVIPDSVTLIEAYAFYQCRELASLVLGNSLTIIGDWAFRECSKLSGQLVIPDTVTEIRGSAFNACGFTGNLIIPNSVTTIGGYAFYSSGFSGQIIIGESVADIGNVAFLLTNAIAYIVIYAQTPPTIQSNSFFGITGYQRIYVPQGKGSAYKEAGNWIQFESIIFELDENGNIPQP